jgi:hypothetical protein
LADFPRRSVRLSDRRSIIALVTLKDRLLSPIAKRYIEYVRDFTKSMREAAVATDRSE